MSVVTNATNSTQYFGFPLFTDADKPSWLVDWNGTVEEIDNLLEEQRLSIAENHGEILTLRTNQERLTQLYTNLNATVEGMKSFEETLGTDVDLIKSTIVQIDTEVKSLAVRVSKLENTVGNAESGLVKQVNDNEAELNRVSGVVGDDTTGLVRDVNHLNDTVGNSSEGLVKDVNSLKNTVGSPSTSGLAHDVKQLRDDSISGGNLSGLFTYNSYDVVKRSYAVGDTIRAKISSDSTTYVSYVFVKKYDSSDNYTITQLRDRQYLEQVTFKGLMTPITSIKGLGGAVNIHQSSSNVVNTGSTYTNKTTFEPANVTRYVNSVEYHMNEDFSGGDIAGNKYLVKIEDENGNDLGVRHMLYRYHGNVSSSAVTCDILGLPLVIPANTRVSLLYQSAEISGNHSTTGNIWIETIDF